MNQNERYISLNAKEELMDEVIYKVIYILKDSQDLMFLTAESALKILHNNFLVMQNQILHSKNTLIQEMIKDKK
jgi:uncharacterized HAD superfamily protein